MSRHRDRCHGNQLYGKLKIQLGQKLKHLNRGFFLAISMLVKKGQNIKIRIYMSRFTYIYIYIYKCLCRRRNGTTILFTTSLTRANTSTNEGKQQKFYLHETRIQPTDQLQTRCCNKRKGKRES